MIKRSHDYTFTSNLHKGYTLIEILLVFAIISVLSTIGFLSAQSYSREQALLTSVRTLQTDLRSAQQLAATGNIPSTCVGYLDGYQFNVTSSNTYEIDALCANGAVHQVLPTKTVTLSADFIISGAASPIVFKTLAQGTNIANGKTANVTITQKSTNKALTIKTGSNGDVQNPVQGSPGPSPTATPSWTYCASKGNTCNFSGTKLVRYGATTYNYGTFTKPVSCNSSHFPGPAVQGSPIHCDYQ